MEEKDYTLIFCRRQTESGTRQVLLGMKKRGFGAGRWNGYGGKLEEGESVQAAAIRELEEESTLRTAQITRRGYIVFHMMERQIYMKVHVFETWNFEGEATETDEMRPQWYDENEIPFDRMWPDDQYWVPDMLQTERNFIGRFDFEDDDTITEQSVKFT